MLLRKTMAHFLIGKPVAGPSGLVEGLVWLAHRSLNTIFDFFSGSEGQSKLCFDASKSFARFFSKEGQLRGRLQARAGRKKGRQKGR